MSPRSESGPHDADAYLGILQPDRCPLCFLLDNYAHEHLKSLLDESVTDPISREALFKSRGFCRRHAWKAVAQGQQLGMAVIYGSLLEKGLKGLSPKPRLWGKSELKPCPICSSLEKREASAVGQFAACWDGSAALRSAFEARGILCFPHLEKTLAQKMGSAYRESLYGTGRKALACLLEDLNEFLEKQDYHRSHETLGPERDAWVRAVRMMAGERE